MSTESSPDASIACFTLSSTLVSHGFSLLILSYEYLKQSVKGQSGLECGSRGRIYVSVTGRVDAQCVGKSVEVIVFICIGGLFQ